MLDEVARDALATIGRLEGPVEWLAEGMSSSAWTGVVDGTTRVVRVPKMDGMRPTPRYDLELRLLAELAQRGVPVMPGRLVSVGGIRCAVADYCDHPPVVDWSDDFVADVASAFATIHSVDPLLAVEADIVARLHLARSWPFDGTDLAQHSIARWGHGLVRSIEARRDEIVWAAEQHVAVVHTDLHTNHLLQDEQGRLAAILDFADAFAGSVGWDFASMRYSFGSQITDRILGAYPGGRDLASDLDVLVIPWALYKLDKTPDREVVQQRVATLLGVDKPAPE